MLEIGITFLVCLLAIPIWMSDMVFAIPPLAQYLISVVYLALWFAYGFLRGRQQKSWCILFSFIFWTLGFFSYLGYVGELKLLSDYFFTRFTGPGLILGLFGLSCVHSIWALIFLLTKLGFPGHSVVVQFLLICTVPVLLTILGYFIGGNLKTRKD
jgi:hypothetical protein